MIPLKNNLLSMSKAPWILTVVVFVLSTSCNKNTDKPLPPFTPVPTGPFLYVGGGTTNHQGIYWKTQLNHPVPVADTVMNANVITHMISADDGLYFAAQTGGYWKDDSFVAVPDALQIAYVAVSGNTVYAAGLNKYIDIAYWAGNVEADLRNTYTKARYPDQSVVSFGVSGMAVTGGNVYVAGYMSFENYPGTPDSVISGSFALLWTNGNMQPYGPGALLSSYDQITKGVAIAGNDVYVAGHYPDTTYAGGYWKNGVWNSIAGGTFLPSAIATNGTSVCIPGNYWARGSYTQGAAYWLDGKLNPLGGAYALAATYFNSDIYIVGVDYQNDIEVWKNGNRFETIGSAANLIATSIVVH